MSPLLQSLLLRDLDTCFRWKLSDWGQELFSRFSRNFMRKLLSCNPAGKRPGKMNNWWREMDGFPSAESRSNCDSYYLEWRVRCELSAAPPGAFFFFLSLLAPRLQPFSSSVLFLFPWLSFQSLFKTFFLFLLSVRKLFFLFQFDDVNSWRPRTILSWVLQKVAEVWCDCSCRLLVTENQRARSASCRDFQHQTAAQEVQISRSYQQKIDLFFIFLHWKVKYWHNKSF